MSGMILASVVTAVGTLVAPTGQMPRAVTCATSLDGGVFRPAYCAKKPPTKSYERFRKGLAAYQRAMFGLADSIGTAVEDLQPIEAQCKDNPPVDPTTVDVIVSGLGMNGGPNRDRAARAINEMLAVEKALFTDGSTMPGEVKAVLTGLRGNLAALESVMADLVVVGDLFKAGACDTASDMNVQAGEDLVTYGTFSNNSVVSLTRMLSGTHKPCKSTKVGDPYSDKALRRAAGAKTTKSAAAGDITIEYPATLDVGGKRVYLPLNLDSAAPSAYVQLVFKQGSKELVAVGGGTPAGESGVRIRLLGKPKPGKAKLRVTFEAAGGSPVSKTVAVKLI